MTTDTLLELAAADGAQGWTLAEVAAAIARSIARHERSGWEWRPPHLVKGSVSIRPTALMALPTPAQKGYNPNTDAIALRLGGTLIRSGPWAGHYEVSANVIMRWDGNLLDTEECPECQGQPWAVKSASVFDPSQRTQFTYCRRCVGRGEIEALHERAREQAPAPRRGR